MLFSGICAKLYISLTATETQAEGTSTAPSPTASAPHIQTWTKDGSCVKNSRKQASTRRETQAEKEQRQQDFHGDRVTYSSFQSQMKQILTLGAAGYWGQVLLR